MDFPPITGKDAGDTVGGNAMTEETALLLIEAINHLEDRAGSIVLFLGILILGKIFKTITEWM